MKNTVKSSHGHTALQQVLAPSYAQWTAGDALDHFGHRTEVKYFAVPDEEQTAREKIDSILEHRFEFNDEVHLFSQEIAWLDNPSRDIEWLILLHKFYYAVGLGMAYRETDDLRYCDKWIELIESWIDAVPLDFLSSDVTGRRVQNWIYSHGYFVRPGSTAVVAPRFYEKFLVSLAQQVSYLCNHLTPARNHRTIELSAIFLAAVVFPEFKDAPGWLDFSRDELRKNIQSDFFADGVHCELSTDYHHLVLKNYLGIKRLAKLNGLSLPPQIDTGLRKALRFALFVHKPDGAIPSLSDGDARGFLDLLRQGYELYGDQELLYAATQGRSGHVPAERSKGFAESGYYILRSGWGERGETYEDEKYLVFDCGPLGVGNHGHLDLLSFEMSAYGQPLVVDPGRYTYDESGPTNWRVMFRGTDYHNTVIVDGKNQTRYRFRKTRYKILGPPPEYELRAFAPHQALDYLCGVARSHEYDAVHERRIFFPGLEYWLVTDILKSPDTHDYTAVFHLSDRAWQNVALTQTRQTVLVNAPHLVVAQPRDPDTSVVIEDGYVSRVYGVKHPAPIVRFTRRASNAIFHTVLFPYRKDRPNVSVDVIPVRCNTDESEPADAIAVRITIVQNGRSRTDYIFSSDAQERCDYTFDQFTYDRTLLYLSMDDTGQTTKMMRQPGTTLLGRDGIVFTEQLY